MTTPLRLPCGLVSKNRLIKAAMTEGLADVDGLPNEKHCRLYRTWAESGCAVLITGNVMVDADHLERPGNVIIDRELNEEELSALRAWADAARTGGSELWLQISHAGRQTQKKINPHPKSASDVPLGIPGGQFARPQALSEEEIMQLVDRYANAAVMAMRAGFSGAQIHGAHGYLVSQFLSPKANRREDQWGGCLENRARFLRAIVAATRQQTSREFAISVKLNSSDFQKGGFEADDARRVVAWLEEDGVDLVELSGGTYEQPKMLEFEGLEPPEEIRLRASTRQREAFFQSFAAELKDSVNVPLMVTGGFRSASGMAEAIDEDGISVIGLARPLCGDPGCTRELLEHGRDLPRFEKLLGNPKGFFGVNSPVKVVKVMASFAVMAWYYDQIVRMGEGRQPDLDPATFKRFLGLQSSESRWLKARRRWLNKHTGARGHPRGPNIGSH